MADHSDTQHSTKMSATGRDPGGSYIALFAIGCAVLLALTIIYMVLFQDTRAVDVTPPTVEQSE